LGASGRAVHLNSSITDAGAAQSRITRYYLDVTGSRFWRVCADVDPMLIAIFLPWSTSLVGLMWFLWLIVIIPRIDRDFLQTLRHPVSLAAIALVGLAAVGVLWSEGPWGARISAIAPAAKLLLVPLLFYHYQRSPRAHWVLWGFIGSCTVLLFCSLTIYVQPGWQPATAHGFDITGVPVRNAIDQNQEFAFCGFVLAWIAVDAFRKRQVGLAVMLLCLATLFFANIFFIALARTSLVYIIPLATLFVLGLFSRKAAAIGLLALVVGVAALWTTSPYLRGRVANVAVEYQQYRETNRPTSTGQRLQYWASAVDWIKGAPIFGHGTGATKRLYNQAAEGKAGAWGQRIGNPHNQLLYVAIEWGLLGCAVLLLLWYQHFQHFRGAGIVAWIGTLVVVQNVLSSMLNSHIFDFTEGWMYVLGVGAAAGARRKSSGKSRESANPAEQV